MACVRAIIRHAQERLHVGRCVAPNKGRSHARLVCEIAVVGVRTVTIENVVVDFGCATSAVVQLHFVCLNKGIVKRVVSENEPPALVAVVRRSSIEHIIFEKNELIGAKIRGARPGAISRTCRIAPHASVADSNAVIYSVAIFVEDAMVNHAIEPIVEFHTETRRGTWLKNKVHVIHSKILTVTADIDDTVVRRRAVSVLLYSDATQPKNRSRSCSSEIDCRAV